jgi:nitrogen fixation protein NifU and related proteins
MSDLRELYQEVILDHSRNPRNFRYPEPANRSGEGYNPLCGDKISVKLRLDGDRIEDIGFQGSGCAISTAAASTMTEVVKGLTLSEAKAIFESYHAVVTGKDALPDLEKLGKLAVFAGVSEFPMRVKCATLAWHTFQAAAEGQDEAVTTE